MNSTKFSYAPNRRELAGYASSYVGDSFPTLKKGEWTHVKVQIDTEAGQYILTVGDSTVKLNYDLANYMTGGQSIVDSGGTMPAFANVYNIETGKLKIVPGFGGISFKVEAVGTAGLQNAVELDNVEVYTEDSLNSYSEFDNVARGATVAVNEQNNVNNGINMPDWFSVIHPNLVLYQRKSNGIITTSGQGRNYATDSSDKSLMINVGGSGAGELVHPFNVPVKAGREFNVEFDYKSSSDQAFALALLEKGNICDYQLSEWHTLNGSLMSGMIEDTFETAANTGKSNAGRIIFANWAPDQVASGGNTATDSFTFRSGSYYPTWQGQTEAVVSEADNSVPVKYKKGEWHHIKLNVKPYLRDDGYDVLMIQAAITYEDGTTVTSQPYTTSILTDDIAAIYFKFNPKNVTGVANHQHLIDNFKVSEVGEVSNNYVTSISAVDADGSTEVLTETVKNSTSKLLINFAHKISDTNSVQIVKADKTPVLADISVSEDGFAAVVTLNEALEIGNEITVEVSENQNAANSTYLQNNEGFKDIFVVTDSGKKLSVQELRLYKWFDVRTFESSTGEKLPSGEGFFPVSASELKDLCASDKYKVAVTGYNYSGEEYTLSFVKATYEDGRLVNAEIIPKTVSEGIFDISEEVTFEDNERGNVKYFIWNNMTPLAENLDYNMTIAEYQGM